jgi:DNA ligase (NAD+)
MQHLYSLDDVNKFVAYWDKERSKLPIATDGLVFKVNSLRQQLNLGNTAKSPRWAIAYKFNPERACTPLKFVSFETGRMGIITPVANLEPVLLSGTIVKRASLHNADIIKELDIHEGDSVYVEKGGEIIPKIVGIDLNSRKKDSKPIEFVTECPECGTPLVREKGEAAWVCPNQYGCRPQITGKIEHFAARKMMNIDGIGEETAELLYDSGLVKTVADLYALTESDLYGLERMGEKMAKKIIKGIEDSKNRPFERVIYALSIPNVGETTAKRLAQSVVSMERLKELTVEELTAIPDVGPIIARSIYDFLREPINVEIINTLTIAGLQMCLSEEKLQAKGTSLEGKSIVISGTFTQHSREEYKEIIEREGGKNVGSISQKTSFVLAGENMGPSKRAKCESLGIPMVSENEFLSMINK